MSTKAAGSNSDSALRGSSRGWTQAESAAACVLRYVTAMRGQLVEWMDDVELADQAIALLLSHLAKKGYSGLAKGRLRDFLIRGIRSAAKVVLADLPEDERPAADLKFMRSDSEAWLGHWRRCLLETAWRALEREEHQSCDGFAFAALWSATQHREETAEALALRLSAAKQRQISPQEAAEQLKQSRERFAELLTREIECTLENPTPEAVRKEFADLKLSDKLP